MIIRLILGTLFVYLCGGCIFSIPFIIKGVEAIDEGAKGSRPAFRIIILPGVIIFWPFLLKKWITRKNQQP